MNREPSIGVSVRNKSGRLLAVTAAAAIAVSCGGSSATPTSPNSPDATGSPFAGSWRGVAAVASCVPDSAGDDVCEQVTSRTPFLSVLTFRPSSDDFAGDVSTMFYRFTLSGRVDQDGTLTLTGEGFQTLLPARASVMDWRMRTDGTVMTGSFTYHALGAIISVRLEYVSLNGTVQIPADSRFGIVASSTTVRSGSPLPFYQMCVSFTNAAPVGVRISSAITPIAASGVEYAVEQPVSTRDLVAFGTTNTCISGVDRESRPLGSSLRFHVDLTWDDQVVGHLDLTEPLTVIP